MAKVFPTGINTEKIRLFVKPSKKKNPEKRREGKNRKGRRQEKMKKLLFFYGLFLIGCSTQPIKQNEFFPKQNTDPRLGLFVNEGEAHLNVFIYDEADRLVDAIYFAGVNRVLTVNGQEWPRICGFRLKPGRYRLEVLPFYYQTDTANVVLNWVGKLWGRSPEPLRYRIDLPAQQIYLLVDRDPTDVYYEGRHFGWVCHLNGGRIPETTTGFPGLKVNVWGDF